MKFTGSAKYVAFSPQRIWDPTRGWTIAQSFRGALTDLVALEAIYLSAGARTDLQPHEEGGYGRLTVYVGAEATQPPEIPLIDRWTLAQNDLEKSIFESPRVLAAFPDASVTERTGMRRFVEDVLSGEVSAGEVAALFQDAEQQQVVTDLILDMSVGVETFPHTQYVLRRTLIIASNSTIKPSLANVNKIYTTAQLQAAEAIPATIRFDLPAGYWLKRGAVVDQQRLDQWTITQEWWHGDQYSRFLEAIDA